MVTAVDRASEALIVGAIERERPDDGVLGEEGSSREGTSGVRWVIDPLDGTTNYLYGLPLFAVSIGVEVDNVMEAGVVAHPSLGEVFTARRGGGAHCNGQPIAVSGKDDLSTALVGARASVGPRHQARRRRCARPVLGRLWPPRRVLRGGPRAMGRGRRRPH